MTSKIAMKRQTKGHPATALKAVAGACLLLVAVALVFSPIVSAPFLFDDFTVVQADEPITDVRAGFASSIRLFPGLSRKPRPVRQFTHRLDALLAGPDNAAFPHAVNLALHFAAGILFFLLLRRLAVGWPVASASLALFLVNPVCVESVGVVSHRKELLSALFALLSIHALLSPGRLATPAYAGTLFLAMFSKETAAIAPLLFLVAAIERGRVGRSGPMLRREDAFRFWIGAAVAVLLACLAHWQIRLGMASAGIEPGLVADRPGHFASGAPWGLVFSAALRAFPRYLWLLAWPAGHTVDPLFSLETPLFSAATALAAAFCVLGLAALCRTLRHRSDWFAPLAWVAIALSPCLFPPFLRGGHTAALADRYSYVALMGFSWGLAMACDHLLRKAHRRVFGLAVGTIAAVFAACAHLQSRDYLSIEAFWARAVRHNPVSAPSRFNHAMSLWRDKGDTVSAREEFGRTIAMAPDNAVAVCGFADLLLAEGEGDRALEMVDSALARPTLRTAGILLRKKAALLLALSRFSEALSAFRAAEAAGVDAPPFQRGFAEACKRNLLWPEAVERYRRAAESPAFRRAYERHRLLIENPPLAATAPLDVLVVGDSVPHGTGAAGPDGRERPLAERLAAKRPGLRVQDASVPGLTAYETNRDFLSLLPSTNAPARVCLLMTGHNDAFAGRAAEGILFEISGCVFNARQCGMCPVVVGPIRVESVAGRDRGVQEAALERLDGLLNAFCRETNVPFVSVRRAFSAGSLHNTDWIDPVTGNHLTDAGLDLLADACLPEISAFLHPKDMTP